MFAVAAQILEVKVESSAVRPVEEVESPFEVV